MIKSMEISKIAGLVSNQMGLIDSSLEKLNSLTMEIASIAAPPFGEGERGKFIAEKFRDMGYPTMIDEVGNVIASTSLGSKNDAQDCIVICAHLDTVFPEGTPLKIRRDGNRIFGPGVGDDSRGLANLLIIAELLRKFQGKLPIYFIANVGEEGIGDLRGTKHIFFGSEHQNRFAKIKYFITIDSAGAGTIVSQSIGSKRYRIIFTGPGGHSFQHFGRANPVYALSNFIVSLKSLKLPKSVKTTYNVGLVEGGISVNAIPEKATCLVDVRSEDPDALLKLEQQIRNLVEKAKKVESTSSEGFIAASIEKIGDRPAGRCPEGKLLTNAIEVTKFFGVPVELKASSTDANIPQNLGIQGIAVSGSGLAGNAHSLDEWVDASNSSLLPLKRNFLLIVSLLV